MRGVPTVLVVDADLKAIGSPVADWTQIEVAQEFNAVGSGFIEAPATPAFIEAVTANEARIVIIREGSVFAGGPIEKPGAKAWKAEDGGVGLARVNFATYEALLADRLTYPDPTLASTAQVTAAYTAAAVNGEVLMRDLVNRNAGLGALVGRRCPRLQLGALSGVGGPVTLTTRFEVLTDVLRTVALAGGGLGFRVVQVDKDLLFEVYQPANKTTRVRFSTGLGNLREYTMDPEAAIATVAIVGGDGEGEARTVVERTDATGLALRGRKETWVGASGTGVELEQAGDAALIEKGEKLGISAVAFETPQTRYGVDVFLGDLVGVEPVSGYGVSALVSAVKYGATPEGGESLVYTLGVTADDEDKQLAYIRQIERRLSRFERG